MLCLVVYDVPDDAVRAKVADACLDYGLTRIQYSAFMGDISPNYQEELFLKIRRQVGDRPANVQLFPICDRDLRRRRVLAVGAPGNTTAAPSLAALPPAANPPARAAKRHRSQQPARSPLPAPSRRDRSFAGREA